VNPDPGSPAIRAPIMQPPPPHPETDQTCSGRMWDDLLERVHGHELAKVSGSPVEGVVPRAPLCA